MDEQDLTNGRQEDGLEALRIELEALRDQVDTLRESGWVSPVQAGQSGDAPPELDEPAFEARLRRAREDGDLLEALKVKQEAARAGVVLL